jgi:hypothetical protein
MLELHRACLGLDDDDIDLIADQVSREFAKSIHSFGGKAMEELGVLAFDVTEIAERAGQGIQPWLLFVCTAPVPKEANFCNSGNARSLLRVRHEAPNRRQSNNPDELPPSHCVPALQGPRSVRYSDFDFVQPQVVG